MFDRWLVFQLLFDGILHIYSKIHRKTFQPNTSYCQYCSRYIYTTFPSDSDRKLKWETFLLTSVLKWNQNWCILYRSALEHFFLPYPNNNCISGVIGAFGWALGPILGGQFLVQQCKKPRGAMKLVVILSAFTLGCFFLLMFLSCPKQEFSGIVTTSEYVLFFKIMDKNLSTRTNNHPKAISALLSIVINTRPIIRS